MVSQVQEDKLVACKVQFGNSSGTATGSDIVSFSRPNGQVGTNGTHTATITPGNSYTLTNQAGATHLIYRTQGGPGPQENSAFSGSMGSTSMTITQNRQVTTNINTSVPDSGEFQFSDMYGAFDV